MSPTLLPQPTAEQLALAQAELANRTYHAGEKPTAGRGYDDRLTVRLGLSQNTVYKYLELPAHRGGIRHRRFGKKIHVTERALREWEGDFTAAT